MRSIVKKLGIRFVYGQNLKIKTARVKVCVSKLHFSLTQFPIKKFSGAVDFCSFLAAACSLRMSLMNWCASSNSRMNEYKIHSCSSKLGNWSFEFLSGRFAAADVQEICLFLVSSYVVYYCSYSQAYMIISFFLFLLLLE